MRLATLEIQGYRRFAAKSTIHLDSKLVAIVGPNEAGKTSVLQALQHLNEGNAFRTNGESQEICRSEPVGSDSVVLIAKYLLEESDHEIIKDIPGAEHVRWFLLYKKADGNFMTSVTPRPTRPIHPLTKAIDTLASLMLDLDQSEDVHVREQISDLVALLKELPNGDIPEELIERLVVIEQELRPPERQAGLALEAVAALVASHNGASPSDRCRTMLLERRPIAALFDIATSSLAPRYNLVALDKNASPAFRNLARLARLDLSTLGRAIEFGDRGKVEHLIESANLALEEEIHCAWKQSTVSVRLSIDNAFIHILVGATGTGYTTIAERSDGLRQFLALFAFAKAEEIDRNSILLIDEAETHLHYDAQADLIQMLERQELFAQVIYTTHSLGCLPEDLGSGVRMVYRVDEVTSDVQNWFWTSERPGFSPLLFGMGASTLAFIPVRVAVIAEGASDMILLPVLVREATNRQTIGYQTAPGLSETSVDEISILDSESSRTAYLIDGDTGGAAIRSKLRKGGVTENRVVGLESVHATTIEDLVDPQVLSEAIREELHRSHGDTPAFPAAFPRPAWREVEAWCKAAGFPPPSKARVAYRVVDIARTGRSIVETQTRAAVQNLDQSLRDALGLN